MNEQVEKFWRVNETITSCPRSVEKTRCGKRLMESYKRDVDGRFEVDLLLKEDFQQLGDSRMTA